MGTHSGGTHPPWGPTGRLPSGQMCTGTWRNPLSPGGSHCYLEEVLSPGGARVALLGQGCTHEHPVPLSPRVWGHPLAWSRVQLLTKHKHSQGGFQVPCNPATSFALGLQSQGLTHRKLGRSQVGCPGCGGHRSPPTPVTFPPHSATWCQAGPASAADEKDLCQATSSSATNR